MTIVVTHHAPSARSLASAFANDALSPAYASDLDDLIEASGAALWIHEHTQHCVDYEVGNTRVWSNQRGYPDDLVADFDPEGLLVLGEQRP